MKSFQVFSNNAVVSDMFQLAQEVMDPDPFLLQAEEETPVILPQCSIVVKTFGVMVLNFQYDAAAVHREDAEQTGKGNGTSTLGKGNANSFGGEDPVEALTALTPEPTVQEFVQIEDNIFVILIFIVFAFISVH